MTDVQKLIKPFRAWQWTMTQTWEHLLFAHWPVAPQTISKFIPGDLEIDTFDGQAWIGVIPFLMSGIRLRALPPIPLMSAFPEINVRTYVKTDQGSGVYFITLDASNPFVVGVAKLWYRLPYFFADLTFTHKRDSMEFKGQRLPFTRKAESFYGLYGPGSDPFVPQAGTLEHWLTERYFFYCSNAGGIFQGEVLHEPWKLQSAVTMISQNTMTQSLHLHLPETPAVMHYARGVQSLIGPIRKFRPMSETREEAAGILLPSGSRS
ncbi:YqjF family protein [Paenibacillus sp. GCM10027628]|uniref:YqjF family protein n=1 Tax=Paenibacillus sp. GCM10027628 TaxID=3273413 RepID=UPI00362D205F